MEVSLSPLEGTNTEFPTFEEERPQEKPPMIIQGPIGNSVENLRRLNSEVVYQANLREATNPSDQAFIASLTSKEYVNTIVNYEYQGTTYPIRVIHNPENLPLWGGCLVGPLTMTHVVTSNVPPLLQRHLEDILTKWGISLDQNGIELSGGSALTNKQWGEIIPVYIAQEIADVKNDARVKKILLSPTFRNEVLYYSLNGTFFQVRILYNPNEETFKATRHYRLGSSKKSRPIDYTWDKKYGIIIDSPAPKELIKHLSSHFNLSWWDWFFKYKSLSGAIIRYTETDYSAFTNTFHQTDYFLDNAFLYTEGLAIQK